jgi:CysZ protein
MTGAPDRAPNAVVRFFRAFTLPFRGLRLVFVEHPGLARYWVWPVLITISAIVAGAVASWVWNDDLLRLLWPDRAPDPAGGALDMAARVAKSVVEFLLGVVLMLASVLVAVLVAGPVASPFNDALSRALEDRMGGAPAAQGSILHDVVRSVFLEVAKLAVLVAVLGPLLLISLFVPVVGPVVYTLVAGALTSFYFAVDYTEWPWARRGLGLRARMNEAVRDLPTTLGFGAGVWVLMFVPLVNLALMPAAVAGGTLLVRESARQSAARPDPSIAP